MADAPTRRVTARVLPVSPDGAVLLLEERNPAHPERRYWSSIGGAVDAGESMAEAAARELFEETGITVAVTDLHGPVLVDDNAYTWGGVDYLGSHSYFTAALPQAVEVSFEHLEPEEIGNILGSRWWRPTELTADVALEPPNLPDIIRAAVDATPAHQPGGNA